MTQEHGLQMMPPAALTCRGQRRDSRSLGLVAAGMKDGHCGPWPHRGPSGEAGARAASVLVPPPSVQPALSVRVSVWLGTRASLWPVLGLAGDWTCCPTDHPDDHRLRGQIPPDLEREAPGGNLHPHRCLLFRSSCGEPLPLAGPGRRDHRLPWAPVHSGDMEQEQEPT